MKRLLDPARRGTQPCKLRTPRFGTKRASSTAQGEARDTATWLARHDRLPDGEGEGVPEEARRRPAPLSCLSLFHSPGKKEGSPLERRLPKPRGFRESARSTPRRNGGLSLTL